MHGMGGGSQCVTVCVEGGPSVCAGARGPSTLPAPLSWMHVCFFDND